MRVRSSRNRAGVGLVLVGVLVAAAGLPGGKSASGDPSGEGKVSPPTGGLGDLRMPPSTSLVQPRAPEQSAPRGGAVPRHVPDELIVLFRRGTTAAERADVRRRHGAKLEDKLTIAPVELLKLEKGTSELEAAAALERDPSVEGAGLNELKRVLRTPNDPQFGKLWGLDNTGQTVGGTAGTPDADIDAPEAWDQTTGSSSVTVAVVDGGIDFDHPDLDDNTWTNPGEMGGGKRSNGIDDDGNGYKDDWRGWDFWGWNNEPREPSDGSGHGTHVSGTIGAEGDNGAGVTGVNWNVKIMPLRVCNKWGSVCEEWMITKAIEYAADNGADVVNMSLGGELPDPGMDGAIAAASDMLVVVAAGNDGRNNDVVPMYPCNYTHANLICVAASDQNDNRPGFSNWGLTSVDLAAPGVNIKSTVPFLGPDPDYARMSGTSMASPHVAGAAALYLARSPGTPVSELRADLLGSVDPLPAFAGITASGGRLNAGRLIGAPPAPKALGTDPSSHANENNPFVFGLVGSGSNSGTTVDIYTTNDCSGTPVASGPESQFEGVLPSRGIQVWVADNSTTTFRATATNPQSGYTSRCSSSSVTYEEFSSQPPPTLIGTDPSSPANDNNPFVFGLVGSGSDSGTTVSIYATNDCSGSPVASGPESQFEGVLPWRGIQVSVADNSTTIFRATATDMRTGVTSPCSSSSITYEEDSTSPETTIDSGPSGPTPDSTPTFTFRSNEPGSTFDCSFDDDSDAAFGPCSGPGNSHTPAGSLGEGPHTFYVRATDAAGNRDLHPASSWFTVVNVAGAVEVRDSTLHFTAGEGSENEVAISLSGGYFRIIDTGAALEAISSDCSGTGVVTCSAAGVEQIEVDTGDLDDTVSVTAGTDSTIDGGPGDDTLAGGSGSDVFVGGLGTDTVDYSAATSTVVVRLDGRPNDRDGLGGRDNVGEDVENLIGSPGRDKFFGQKTAAVANRFEGRDGKDVLKGYGGADILIGGDGKDKLDGGNENDELRDSGLAGERNTLKGGNDDDVLHGGLGDDRLIGGSGSDTLYADNAGRDRVVGGADNDTVYARDNSDDADRINCGTGLADWVQADAIDKISPNCEVEDPIVEGTPAADGSDTPGGSAPAPAGGLELLAGDDSAATQGTSLSIRTAAARMTSGGVVRLRLRCFSQETRCKGTLRLRTVRALKSGRKARKLTLARLSFRVPAGRTRTVKVRLSRAGRRALRRQRRLRVAAAAKANARGQPAGVRRTARRAITLRAG